MLFLQKLLSVNISDYKKLFLDFLTSKEITKEPKNLYEPVNYILELGGKRLRPVLVLISTEAFGGKVKEALDAALAIEMFHNFTLLHDDIMDDAPIRRGNATVHKKWNVNTGILSGDVMMINSYQCLEKYATEMFKKLSILFNRTAVEVCEGQQYDIDFETRNDVSLVEYLTMIKLKTSVLIGAALQMGAIISKANSKEQKKIYNFGEAIGMAFQLQDDYLDTFGTSETFGKQIGGDILERKKTWLYLKTMEIASENDKKTLLAIYNDTKNADFDDISTVKAMFEKYKIAILLKEQIQLYSSNALDQLEELKLAAEPKKLLMELVYSLKTRTN